MLLKVLTGRVRGPRVEFVVLSCHSRPSWLQALTGLSYLWQVMQEKKISREDMQSDTTFLQLQRCILQAQCILDKASAEAADEEGASRVMADRCGVDPLAFTALRFGTASEQVLFVQLHFGTIIWLVVNFYIRSTSWPAQVLLFI